jgi:chromosome condensin MukBEF ATPase and DNA-binding subunit MukB
LRNELDQVAKQQDVERETEVLTTHQTKLEELKYVVTKVSARFSALNTEDDTSNTEVLQLASSLSDIERKLVVQVYGRPPSSVDWNVVSTYL